MEGLGAVALNELLQTETVVEDIVIEGDNILLAVRSVVTKLFLVINAHEGIVHHGAATVGCGECTIQVFVVETEHAVLAVAYNVVDGALLDGDTLDATIPE